jgi:hypothetical protein
MTTTAGARTAGASTGRALTTSGSAGSWTRRFARTRGEAAAAQAPTTGPYAVLKTTKVGGLGGFDDIWVFSHPTQDATVVDAKDGTVVGK